MALGTGLVIGGHRFFMRLLQRLVDVREDIANLVGAIVLAHFGYGLDGLGPARRVRRHIDRFLVILFDRIDGLTQFAVQ